MQICRPNKPSLHPAASVRRVLVYLVASHQTLMKFSKIECQLLNVAHALSAVLGSRETHRLAIRSWLGIGVLALWGCGSTPTPSSPHLALAASSMSFSNQLVGGASPGQVEVVSNTGNGPLLISSASVTGTGDAAFSLTNGCNNPVSPGGTCRITVSFTPPAMGSFVATLAIAGNANASGTISLSGTGIAPVAQFSEAQIAFPSMDVGYASDPDILHLANSGTAPLDLSGMTISGSGAPAFKASDSTCGQSLAAGATCSISVTFVPAAATVYSAVLSLGANAGSTAQSVTLSGSGIPDTPLSAWKYAYKHCSTEPVNVLVFGDSRSIIDSTIVPWAAPFLADTFGQRWPDRLAASLQAICGSHGSGLVPFLPVAQGQFLNGDFYQIQGSWTTAPGLGPYQLGGVPTTVLLQTTSAATLQFNVAQPYDHLNVYCSSGPGLNAWTMSIDGVPAGTCGGADTTQRPVLATSAAVPSGKHTAALICALAPCAAYGMEATSGSTGVSVHNLSIGSCAAECFGLDPARQLVFSDLIPGHHLVILGLLTNDPGVGYSPDSFGASLGRIIEHERALPTAPSILIYAPLQDMISGQGPYYPVLPSVARTYSTAYFDLRGTYGSGFLPQYFGPDQAHENNAGHALVFENVLSTITP